MEPYGKATVFGTPSAGLDLRLPGQWSEAETGGLSQNWFRNYDPSLGRYAQVDPIGLGGGQNPYVYVDGDPSSGIDPEGLEIRWLDGPSATQSSSVNPSATYNVFAHGNDYVIFRDHKPILPAELANIIENDLDYSRKPRTVVLHACLVGRHGYAKALADRLGVDVITTADYVLFYSGEAHPWKGYADDSTKSGFHPTEPGKWTTVHPSGPHQ